MFVSYIAYIRQDPIFVSYIAYIRDIYNIGNIDMLDVARTVVLPAMRRCAKATAFPTFGLYVRRIAQSKLSWHRSQANSTAKSGQC